jgi:hypothetical protein
MDEQQIQARIETLEDEERRLRADEATLADQAASADLAADRDRLGAIRVELDQLWDLLRRQRALRASGQDPDGAKLRDPGTVEGYLG